MNSATPQSCGWTGTASAHPSDATPLYVLGSAHTRCSRHDEAVALLERAATIGRGSVVLGLLGLAYAAAGRHADAEQLFQELSARAERNYVASVIPCVLSGSLKWLASPTSGHPGPHGRSVGLLPRRRPAMALAASPRPRCPLRRRTRLFPVDSVALMPPVYHGRAPGGMR